MDAQNQITPADSTEQPQNLSSTAWVNEIKAAEKNLEKWHEQAERINLRFLDKREAAAESSNRINLFTANTLILISTLYARFPKPIVTREYEDQRDEIGRTAATIMERMLKIRSRSDFDVAMKQIVQDRLVPGLGQMWLRYAPTFATETVPAQFDAMGNQISEAQNVEVIADEAVAVDYVYWKDFLYSPARTWAEVRWVGRRIKMTKDDAKERFGEVIANQLRYSAGQVGTQVYTGSPEDKVEYTYVYEIWCKKTRKVYWINKDFEYYCDVKPDMLRLKGFWPCPKPMLALHSSSNLVPRPNYLIAQDQYQELDMVNHRITMIERAIKVVGLADGNNKALEQIFSEGLDNQIVPIPNFRQFAEQGGFKGIVDWLPIEAMVNALDKLRQYRQDLIQQIYEIEGISDIMRGSSKASETLGAQQLKAQYGSIKLQYLQMEVASFVEEALEIKAEIIENHFQPETIFRQTNIGATPDAEFAQQAIQLLKSGQSEFRIEVHADSMAVPEFTAERDGRMMFVRAVSEMLVNAEPLLQRVPEAGITMLELIQWAGASFRTGNSIEAVLDKGIAEIRKALANPPPPAPPPADVVAKTKKDETQAVLNLAKADEATAKAVTITMEPDGDENGGSEGNSGNQQ